MPTAYTATQGKEWATSLANIQYGDVPSLVVEDAPRTLALVGTEGKEWRAAGTVIVAYWEDDIVAQFVAAAIPTSRTTMYTVPLDRNAIIRWLELLNTTGSNITVDVWINNIPWENDRISPANDKYRSDTITEAGPGQLIEMQASASGAYAWLSGVLELVDT